ncbi:CRISPR-associated endonuclease/helicase Cas3 [Castellaniella caeni]
MWGQTRRSLLDTYLAVLAVEVFPSADTVSFAFVNWLAGLTSAADWIASNPKWFPLGEREDDLDTYFQCARELAQNALREIGWGHFQPLLAEAPSLPSLLGRMTKKPGISPRPLQIVGDLLLQEADGPTFLLVEAPMGEGKTELAFLATLRLQQRNQHRGLYIAMPTQATGNAMFKRTLTFLEAFAQQHTDAQLAHGGAFLNDDLAHLRLVDVQRLQGVDQSATETLSASAWFGQRKRPLLSPYGVGTVDQALYAVLPVKHHFVRLWGLGNRVVVFDEIHAYDTYTVDLIVALLRWLKRLGSSVILMSATLPARS